MVSILITPYTLQPSVLASGLLPFGAAFIEGYFLFSSIFASRAYYAFGFLAMTSAVVALTTATVSILFTYFLLCAENYKSVNLILLLFGLTSKLVDGNGGHSQQAVEALSGC
jgi:lipoprotein signal peptidase